ncbi:MAG: hypothetical protein RBR23_04155 [Arcobacteraceae bacterium]|jgi:hypothetical protein|nr:hypothetical protein [Arcobacteraceae bacterium]
MEWIINIFIILAVIGLVVNYFEKKKLERELGRKLGIQEFMDIFQERQKAEKREKKEAAKKAVKDNTKEAVEIALIDTKDEQEITQDKPQSKAQSLPPEFIAFIEREMFDEARRYLQKIAYEMTGKHVPQKDKDDFKKMMTYFADRDPLYREVLRKARKIIETNQGIKQSEIYKSIPEYDTETLRYVFYFGHELGDIHRIKKGRTYIIFTSQEQSERLLDT